MRYRTGSEGGQADREIDGWHVVVVRPASALRKPYVRLDAPSGRSDYPIMYHDGSLGFDVFGGGGVPKKVRAEVVRVLRLIQRGLLPYAETFEQARRSNPFIVTYGNPPLPRGVALEGMTVRGRIVGQIAKELHTIQYEHVGDGKPYEHTFDSPVLAYAVEIGPARLQAVLLIGADGQKVFDDV